MENEDSILRLNKFVAHAGICNRKEAATLIKRGEIFINGNVSYEPFYVVNEGDIITYKGKTLSKVVHLVYVLINKSKNTPITNLENDTKPSVLSLSKRNTEEPMNPVDHLMEDSCGLMVLTNDEALLIKLSDSGNKIKSVFEIELDKDLTSSDLKDLCQVKTDTFRVLGIDFPDDDTHRKIGLEIIGGKVSDIKSLFNTKGYQLTKVDCTFYGGLTKKDLKRGWSRLLNEKEIIFLKHFS